METRFHHILQVGSKIISLYRVAYKLLYNIIDTVINNYYHCVNNLYKEFVACYSYKYSSISLHLVSVFISFQSLRDFRKAKLTRVRIVNERSVKVRRAKRSRLAFARLKGGGVALTTESRSICRILEIAHPQVPSASAPFPHRWELKKFSSPFSVERNIAMRPEATSSKTALRKFTPKIRPRGGEVQMLIRNIE